MIRPAAAALLTRFREPLAAAALLLVGLFVAMQGGWVLLPVGGAIATFSAGWATVALRRLRFAQGVAAPGMVEVDEGQVGYLGPAFGGYVSLPDLIELRLVTMRGRRLWRLRQSDGQALLIPVDAAGAERLFDAFASLPGMDTGSLTAALAPAPDRTASIAAETRVIWRRPGRGVTPA